MNIHKVEVEVGGRLLTLETGKLAKQADGSVLGRYGDTMVLVTVCSASTPKEGIDFFPLTVEFAEKFYAAGRIPGSFFKREGRPTSEATLSARLIDRPIRPLFPENFRCETQVVATVLSFDPTADVDFVAAAATGAALAISNIPFNGPTSACRVGRIGGQWVANPTWEQLQNKESDCDVFIAATRNAIMMVEGGAQEVSEEDILQGILFGHQQIKKVVGAIDELVKKCGNPKRALTENTIPSEIIQAVESAAKTKLQKAFRTKDKHARYALIDEALAETVAKLVPESLVQSKPDQAEATKKQVKTQFELLKYNLMREMILTDRIRIDGRDEKTVRPIAVETGLLPRVHGSALFTRGETQVLATVTLGTKDDEQIIDNLYQNTTRPFLFHYNFPPYSVGEVGRMGGQSRREIGHGALAERGVKALVPKFDDFPYTIRVVCETLESNGSSSMGSVCSSSMALMDAGVKMKSPVAGIAMGLIKEKERVSVLTDILGDEDHLGDMDFKVAGTTTGVTAIQMDIKIEGVTEAIMKQALSQAREGRLHILNEMTKAITAPRAEMSSYAPRITTIQVPISKIGAVIGPGGKVIKDIIARTGCKIDIQDDGKVNIASNDGAAMQKAIEIVQGLVAEVEVGKTYRGKVTKIVEFGAFIAVLPNQEGLLHISEIDHSRVQNVEDFIKEGDEVEVKVLDLDPRSGKMRLSRKVLLGPPPPGTEVDAPRGPPRDFGSRGPRSGGNGRPSSRGRH